MNIESVRGFIAGADLLGSGSGFLAVANASEGDRFRAGNPGPGSISVTILARQLWTACFPQSPRSECDQMIGEHGDVYRGRVTDNQISPKE